ncbi:MAG: hypothetical protein ACP5RR_07835 [Candidatus Kapaibacteriota bacterium]
MSKYLFTFGISGWVIIGSILTSFVLTYFYYRKTNPPIELRKKLFLGGTRFLALLFLFFFFAEPVLNLVSTKIVKPKVAVLIDNSISMKLKWSNNDKYSQTKNAIFSSGLLNFTKYPVNFYRFDAGIKFFEQFNFDSLKFDGEETNLALPLGRIYDLKSSENIQSVVLVTDGIYNSGSNPIYLAERLGIPIYTIGIGDTIPPKDVLISSITTNEVGYVDKPLPVKVSIKFFGYGNQALSVQLFDGQSLVGEQKLELRSGVEDYSVLFEFTPKAEGFAKLTAKIQSLPDEFSTENNQQSQIVKIIKSKKKYIILSGYPNPDISYLKSLILQEAGTEVVTFIQKFGSEFYDPKPTRKDFDEAQIIILLGYPIASSSTQPLDWTLEEWLKGKSVLFVSQLETDYRKLKSYEDILPFNFTSNTPKEYTFVGNFEPTQSGNPLLNVVSGEDNLKLLNQLPPLFRTELFVRAKPESEVLATVKVNNVVMREPFILLNTFQNRKSAAILGYGLYRWRLLGNSLQELIGNGKPIDIGSEFLTKLFQWLTVSDELAKIRIKPIKNKFLKTEKVVFTGQIYDESLNPIDNAKVIVRINKGKDVFDVQLQPVSSGLYSSEVGYFAEGDYSYIGEAFLDNRSLGKVAGRFTVEKSNLELVDFKSRFDFLRYISKTTGGKFYFWNEMDRFKADLGNLILEERVSTVRKEINLWNWLPLLFMSIVLFAFEWYIRRRNGLL